MLNRAIIVSGAMFLGSFSLAYADVASVAEACAGGGAACSAAIKIEIASLPASAVASFLADLAEAAASDPTLSATVAASFSSLAADPAVSAYSQTFASLSKGHSNGTVSKAAKHQRPAHQPVALPMVATAN
jgi:hypothetical protein